MRSRKADLIFYYTTFNKACLLVANAQSVRIKTNPNIKAIGTDKRTISILRRVRINKN